MTNPRDARTDPLELVKLSPPRGWMRWIAVLAAFGGWYVSLDLVRLHYQQPASNPLFQALCGRENRGRLDLRLPIRAAVGVGRRPAQQGRQRARACRSRCSAWRISRSSDVGSCSSARRHGRAGRGTCC